MTLFDVEPRTLPIAGDGPSATAERFPVRRVYCVGQNYADHAREMGSDPDRQAPFFFSKPADAVYAASEGIPAAEGFAGVESGTAPYPPLTADFHFEVELVVAIGAVADAVTPDAALDAVWGYTVGVDLTRRDVQGQAKKSGRPWDLAKGFDASGPVGELVSVERIGQHPVSGRIHLDVDGATRQDGDLDQLIWSVPELVSRLSQEVVLRPGDLIFTGTPAGVGPLERGQSVRAEVAGVGAVEFRVV
jgi:fumarylpyruvate hydrolase